MAPRRSARINPTWIQPPPRSKYSVPLTGRLVRALRVTAGLNQADFARVLQAGAGLALPPTQSHVSQWETGRMRVPEWVIDIAAARVGLAAEGVAELAARPPTEAAAQPRRRGRAPVRPRAVGWAALLQALLGRLPLTSVEVTVLPGGMRQRSLHAQLATRDFLLYLHPTYPGAVLLTLDVGAARVSWHATDEELGPVGAWLAAWTWVQIAPEHDAAQLPQLPFPVHVEVMPASGPRSDCLIYWTETAHARERATRVAAAPFSAPPRSAARLVFADEDETAAQPPPAAQPPLEHREEDDGGA